MSVFFSLNCRASYVFMPSLPTCVRHNMLARSNLLSMLQMTGFYLNGLVNLHFMLHVVTYICINVCL